MSAFRPTSDFGAIAAAILPTGGGVVAVTNLYFDESGPHNGSRTMSVAGYWFDLVQADRFARDWAKDLKRLGLSHAHMTDCVHGLQEYETLSKDECLKSELLLIEHIKRRSSFGFGVAVRPDRYDALVGSIRGAPSCYTFCLMTCVNKVADYARSRGYNGKLAYFFESGHRHSAEAHKFMDHIPNLPPDSLQRKQYAGHSFVDKKLALPLQAADMFAWQLRHFYDRQFDEHFAVRKDFAALLRPFDFHNVVTEKHLLALRKLLVEVGPRLDRGEIAGADEIARSILESLGLPMDQEGRW